MPPVLPGLYGGATPVAANGIDTASYLLRRCGLSRYMVHLVGGKPVPVLNPFLEEGIERPTELDVVRQSSVGAK